MLENIQVIQKLKNVGTRRVSREKMGQSMMMRSPMWPPAIWNAKKVVWSRLRPAKGCQYQSAVAASLRTFRLAVELLNDINSGGWELELKFNFESLSLALVRLRWSHSWWTALYLQHTIGGGELTIQQGVDGGSIVRCQRLAHQAVTLSPKVRISTAAVLSIALRLRRCKDGASSSALSGGWEELQTTTWQVEESLHCCQRLCLELPSPREVGEMHQRPLDEIYDEWSGGMGRFGSHHKSSRRRAGK